MKSMLALIIYSLSAIVIIGNLTFWIIPLYILTPLRFFLSKMKIPVSFFYPFFSKIYRCGVWVHDFWIYRCLKFTPLLETSKIPSFNEGRYILLSNHASYLDIFLIQTFVCKRKSYGKFFLKQELRWHPLVGPIAYAFNFPFIFRKKNKDKNKQMITKALQQNPKDNGITIIYPEGTRFTQKKKEKAQSLYKNLLIPKYKGLEYAIESMGSHLQGVLDVSLAYPEKTNIFFKALSGQMHQASMKVAFYPMTEIENPQQFIQKLWEEKDTWISSKRH